VGLGLTINRSTEQANYREENSVLEWIGRRYMRMQKIRHEEQGFTLIELLIVTKRSVRERSKTPLRLAMCDRVSVPLPLRVIHPSAWKGCSLKFVPSRRYTLKQRS
jgi:hypothetical protein